MIKEEPPFLTALGVLSPTLVRVGETIIIGGDADWTTPARLWFEKVQVVQWYCSGQLVEFKSLEKDNSWSDIRESRNINVFAIL